MSSIPPPRDDHSLPPLRRASPSATRVTATTPAQPAGDQRARRALLSRGPERRRGERRRMQTPVILDTRGRHERRTRQRRAAADAAAPAGWNAYA